MDGVHGQVQNHTEHALMFCKEVALRGWRSTGLAETVEFSVLMEATLGLYGNLNQGAEARIEFDSLTIKGDNLSPALIMTAGTHMPQLVSHIDNSLSARVLAWSCLHRCRGRLFWSTSLLLKKSHR